jgi:hypothetical protein
MCNGFARNEYSKKLPDMTMKLLPPFAGITLIRFNGTISVADFAATPRASKVQK